MLKFIKDFSSRGNFLLGFITLILFLRPGCAFSYAEHIPGPVVTSVIIKVDGQENGEEVAEMLAVKEGEAFSLKKVSDSVKNIFKTGLFSDIQVLKTGEQNIQLTFLLTRY